MIGFAWLTIRQVKEALKNGRPEEALHLLGQQAAQGHQRSWDLLQKTAEAFVERGSRQLQQQNIEGAWNDLLAAEQVGVRGDGAGNLRQALTKQGMVQAREHLERGEPARTLEILQRLRGRMVQQSDLPELEEAAKGWIIAREQASRGEFGQARETCERIAKYVRSENTALGAFNRELANKDRTFGGLLADLHQAALRREWRDVVRLSEEVLAMAPQHLEARKARARAWRAIDPETISSPPLAKSAPPETPAPPTSPRFFLWVDGVGGFLVCLGNQVTIGQATPEATVEIPLFADVSRMHAKLTRESEGYLLEALRTLMVNGQPFTKGPLHSNDRITLGSTCQMQFRMPVPVSASARLDLVSGHRLALSVEAVLLMADTLVLGSTEQSHVQVPDLQKPIVLFRQRDGLGVRCAGAFKIDGVPSQDRGSLRDQATVSGDDFAFAIEPACNTPGRL
jgi:FHA domain